MKFKQKKHYRKGGYRQKRGNKSKKMEEEDQA